MASHQALHIMNLRPVRVPACRRIARASYSPSSSSSISIGVYQRRQQQLLLQQRLQLPRTTPHRCFCCLPGVAPASDRHLLPLLTGTAPNTASPEKLKNPLVHNTVFTQSSVVRINTSGHPYLATAVSPWNSCKLSQIRYFSSTSSAMVATKLDGVAIAKAIRERLGGEIAEKQKLNPRYKPCLKIVQGESPNNEDPLFTLNPPHVAQLGESFN